MICTLIAVSLCLASPGDSEAGESREKGRSALADQSYKVAIGHLKIATDQNPADVESWLLLARSLNGDADQQVVNTPEDWDRTAELMQQAEDSLRQAANADTEGSRTGEIWAELGEVLLKQGKAEEAIATLYHAQQYRENDLRVLRNLGEALLMDRTWAIENERFDHADMRLAEAQRVLEGAAALGDLQADILRSLGEVYTVQSNHESAMSSLRRAITLRPKDVQLHNSYLNSLRASKQFEQGMAFYGGLIDTPALSDWYRAETLEMMGNYAFNKERDYTAAAQHYAQAELGLLASANINPEYQKSARRRIPFLRSFRGYALTEAGDFDAAEAAFFSALDRQSDLPHAVRGLSQLLTAHFNSIGGEGGSREDFDQIRARAARICIVNHRDAAAWNNYGFFAREAGKYEESYQAYRRSIELEFDNPRYLNDTALILVYHLARDYDLAENYLVEARDIADLARTEALAGSDTNRVADLTEIFGDTQINLITLFNHIDRLDDARAIFDRVSEELPGRQELSFWERKLYPERVAQREQEAAKKEAAQRAEQATQVSGD